jgi:hypothetical protein
MPLQKFFKLGCSLAALIGRKICLSSHIDGI